MRSNKLDKSTTREKEVPRLSHKSDKHQPLPKGPKYECYTPLTVNRTTILEEAFNLEVPIKLPLMKPPKMRSDSTKYYKYHYGIGHNTEDC